jgi:phosphatidylglycerol---prolipoprotein diacylglyceryl transferase
VDIALHGLTIGPLEIRFYSLSILTGLIMGVVLARMDASRRGEDPDHVLNIAVLGAIMGIIGARLYHVFDQDVWPQYRANPETIFYVWRGGIGIFGAFAGAVTALLLYVRLKGLTTLRWMDIGAPSFLLGQAIGRWGNFFNQELFGRPTDLPWGITIPEARVLAEAPQYLGFDTFHPLFLYESLLSFLGVAVMVFVARRFGNWLRSGDIFLIYLIWYPAERFALEFLRASKWEQGGLPMAQWISGTLIVVAIGVMVWNHLRAAPAAGDDQGDPSRRSRAAARRRRQRI